MEDGTGEALPVEGEEFIELAGVKYNVLELEGGSSVLTFDDKRAFF
jgi:hypothetical protein